MAISLNSNSLQPGNKYFRRFLNIGNSGRNPFKIFNKLSLEHIKLSSATQALPFYLKTDFECDPLCKMVKDITGGEKSSNMTRKRISRSSNKHSKTCRHY